MKPNMNNRTPEQILRDVAPTQVYSEELAILDYTNEVVQRMNALNLSKGELARRLEVAPAYVSKLIGGSNNFTLRTMVRVARALSSELRFHLQPEGAVSHWRDYAPPIVKQETITPVAPNAHAIEQTYTPTKLPSVPVASYAELAVAA
ncbi:MAG: helix-turn-helix transcriptional regulator [Opitutae bacterium]|nr:helix-turn-helix transcriptional regulator [Opitutae bacterium]